MEYCEKGNLLKYLQHHKYSSNTYVNYDVETLDFRWKIRRAIEICKGMIFLSQKKVFKASFSLDPVFIEQLIFEPSNKNDISKKYSFG